MVTVRVHGIPTQAVELICDPLPGRRTGPTVLRIRWKKADVRPYDGSLAPVMFELGGGLYEGMFRQVARADQPPDEIVCTLISESPVREVTERSWSSVARRLFKRRSVLDG